MVSYALEQDLFPTDLDSKLLAEIAAQVLGQEVHLSDEIIQRALDPSAFVAARTTLGGASSSATAAVLDNQANRITANRQWLRAAHQYLE